MMYVTQFAILCSAIMITENAYRLIVQQGLIEMGKTAHLVNRRVILAII